MSYDLVSPQMETFVYQEKTMKKAFISKMIQMLESEKASIIDRSNANANMEIDTTS